MANRRTQPNQTMFQTFEWHTPSDPANPHYRRLTKLLPTLARVGITSLWLPPGCKANNVDGNGYDIYDLWDLGEFKQKVIRSTKWGSREELDELLRQARRLNIECIWDAVLNHKTAGDRTEDGIWAVEVDEDDRRYEICPPRKIEAWLRYDFPGRGSTYSDFKWRAEHFNGTDWDQKAEKHALYKLIDDPAKHPPFRQPQKPTPKPSVAYNPPTSRFSGLRRKLTPFSTQAPVESFPPPAPPRRPGKGWADDVDDQHGNYDYLLFSNIDYTHPEVRQDALNWGGWMVHEVGVAGFRLDAVQHFSFRFTRDWIQKVNDVHRRRRDGKDVFIVGEVWTGEFDRITKWLDAVQHPQGPKVYNYDSPLVYNFSRISEDVRNPARRKNLDLRTIPHATLFDHRPKAALTLVTNHDTQPGQASAVPMLAEMKGLFYAFVLLRSEGLPCVFWGDMFGTKGPLSEPPGCVNMDARGRKRTLIADLMMCRKLFAYGEERYYPDSSNCIAWSRAGVPDIPGSGCVVVLNTEPIVNKLLARRAPVTGQTVRFGLGIGKPGEVWVDVLGTIQEEVVIDQQRFGAFPTTAEIGVAVFVRKDAVGIREFPVRWDSDIYRGP